MNQTDSNNVKRSDSENPLISLLNEKKTAFEGLSLVQLIRRDFELVVAVREAGATWEEIARKYGFDGKADRARYVFFYERRRREKKEKVKTTVVPAKLGKEVMPANKPVSKATQIQKSKIPLGGRIKEGSNEIVFENSFDIDAID